MSEKYVNARGLQCPGPLVQLSREAKNAAKGDRIIVEATDMGFKKDVAAWCAKTGNRLVNIGECNGVVRAEIEVS